MKELGEVFTPKDYAKWLVEEMEHEIPYVHDPTEPQGDGIAKKCALIAVKSVIDSTRMLVSHYIKSNGVKAYMDIELSKNLTLAYWREVKKEIERL